MRGWSGSKVRRRSPIIISTAMIPVLFIDGVAPGPETTFGTVKADVLDRFVPGFKRGNLVDIIENSDWPK